MTFSFFAQKKCENSHLWQQANDVHIMASDVVHTFLANFDGGWNIYGKCGLGHAQRAFCCRKATKKVTFPGGFCGFYMD